jgi:hypothetical protein
MCRQTQGRNMYVGYFRNFVYGGSTAVLHLTELKSLVWYWWHYHCCHKGALSLWCQLLFSYEGCSWTFLIYLFLRFVCVSYGRFMAVRYKFNLPMCVQEPLVIGRCCTGRDLNGEMVGSGQRMPTVHWKSQSLTRAMWGSTSDCDILTMTTTTTTCEWNMCYVEAKGSTSDSDSNIIYGSNSKVTTTKSNKT